MHRIADLLFEIADQEAVRQNSDTKAKVQDGLTDAAAEISNGAYEKAQRILEATAVWDDGIRSAANELHRLDQERRGDPRRLSFNEAQNLLRSYGKGLRSVGSSRANDEAENLESIVRSTSRPGPESLTEALCYVEGLLKVQADFRAYDKTENLRQLEERRSIRDALFEENRKRLRPSAPSTRNLSESADKRQPFDRARDQRQHDDKIEIEKIRVELAAEAAPTARHTDLPNTLAQICNSREHTQALEKPGPYTEARGIAVIAKAFGELYPDRRHLGQRLEALLSTYHAAVLAALIEFPDSNAIGHLNRANRSVIASLNIIEKKTIESFLDANASKLGSQRGQMRVYVELPFHDFLDHLEARRAAMQPTS